MDSRKRYLHDPSVDVPKRTQRRWRRIESINDQNRNQNRGDGDGDGDNDDQADENPRSSEDEVEENENIDIDATVQIPTDQVSDNNSDNGLEVREAENGGNIRDAGAADQYNVNTTDSDDFDIEDRSEQNSGDSEALDTESVDGDSSGGDQGDMEDQNLVSTNRMEKSTQNFEIKFNQE